MLDSYLQGKWLVLLSVRMRESVLCENSYIAYGSQERVFKVFWKLPKRHSKSLKDMVPFDPETQLPIIRASICTGEKVAGFKDKVTGRFTEVMLIRSAADELKFKEAYQIESLETEY